MMKEKRPQDWSLEERLNAVIRCQSLEGEALSAACREQGVFPHHVKQWREDFIRGVARDKSGDAVPEVKRLKRENQLLKTEVARKDKALAEAAALLVLQKKVTALWNNDEDN
jgi:transposase-like protein